MCQRPSQEKAVHDAASDEAAKANPTPAHVSPKTIPTAPAGSPVKPAPKIQQKAAPATAEHPEFPEVEQEEGDAKYVTRREQIGKKKDVKRARGDGKDGKDKEEAPEQSEAKKTAAKSKLRRGRHLDEGDDEEKETPAKKLRSSDEEAKEEGEVPKALAGGEPEKAAPVKRKRGKHQNEPSSGSQAPPKAKAKAKAGAKAKAKAKAGAKAKAQAKSKPEGNRKTAAGKAKAKAKAKVRVGQLLCLRPFQTWKTCAQQSQRKSSAA